MRFGLCCGADQAQEALDAGFDYVELPANRLLTEFERYEKIAPEAMNVFFPNGYRLFGPKPTPYLEYVLETIEAASRVGVQLIAVGSGAARTAPDGTDLRDAQAAFARVCYELYEIADPFNIAIAPESLNRSETNVGTSLHSLSRDLRDLGVGFTLDTYHVISEWVFEGYESPPTRDYWQQQVSWIPTHVHLGSRGRLAPLPDDPDLAGAVHRLRELGYDGRVSLECKLTGERSLAEVLAHARALFAA